MKAARGRSGEGCSRDVGAPVKTGREIVGASRKRRFIYVEVAGSLRGLAEGAGFQLFWRGGRLPA